MADVIVSHAQIQAVKDALAGVQSNGQAFAAGKAAVKSAGDLAKHLRSEGGSYRNAAAKDLDDYAKRVETATKALAGNATGAVGPSWAKAKEQILNLYMLAFTLQSTMPPGVDFGDGWGPALSAAVKELPETIGKAVKVAAAAVQTVVKETAKIGGSLVWGIVAGAWPLLLIVGAAGVGYLVLRKKLPMVVP